MESVEKVLDLWVQLMSNGSKKNCVYIFVYRGENTKKRMVHALPETYYHHAFSQRHKCFERARPATSAQLIREVPPEVLITIHKCTINNKQCSHWPPRHVVWPKGWPLPLVAVDWAKQSDPHMESSRRWTGWHPDWHYLKVKMKVSCAGRVSGGRRWLGEQDARMKHTLFILVSLD